MELLNFRYVKFWAVFLFTAVILLWLLIDIMKPFLLAAVLAYFLDPLVDILERRGFPRILSIAVVLLTAISSILIFLILLIPSLVSQMESLISEAPLFFDTAMKFFEKELPVIFEKFPFIKSGFDELTDQARKNSFGVAIEVVSLTVALVDILLFTFVFPIITFYLLLEWDNIIAKTYSFFPKSYQKNIRSLMTEIDAVLAGFLRGQISVCLILGGLYSGALLLLGLKYAVLIGLFAGLVSFIPFFGAILGGVVSFGFALFQFWPEPFFIFFVLIIFLIGQMLESNFLTPKLVGNAVRLHPVWLMFSLSVFGTLAGVLGLIIAVPIAAVIGVICRRLLERYLNSELYNSG